LFAHIRCLFSGLVGKSLLAFFRASPDSTIQPEFNSDPAARRRRKAGQCPLAREEVS
jgi:hypothetical protein